MKRSVKLIGIVVIGSMTLIISSMSMFLMLSSSSSKSSYRGSVDRDSDVITSSIGDKTETYDVSASLSSHPISFAKATASTLGNLGPPSVILSSSTNDWIKDRWQAAKDMNGTPIPGSHFVQLYTNPSQGFTVISRVIIDWETASASNIRISAIGGSSSTLIYKFGDKRERSKSNKHVIDSIPIDFKSSEVGNIEQIRIDILSPETSWGSSIWHVEVLGF